MTYLKLISIEAMNRTRISCLVRAGTATTVAGGVTVVYVVRAIVGLSSTNVPSVKEGSGNSHTHRT